MFDLMLAMVGICRHSRLTFPITLYRGEEKVTYRVCLNCCRQFEAKLGEEKLGAELE